MKGKGLHKENAKENKPISAEHSVVSKKTTLILLFAVVVLTALITYFVVVSTQTPKIVKEGFPVSKTSGEISLFLKPLKETIKTEGTVSLNVESP